MHARSCLFLVRDVGALGPDGVLEVSSVMVIMAEMVIKVAIVNVVNDAAILKVQSTEILAEVPRRWKRGSVVINSTRSGWITPPRYC